MTYSNHCQSSLKTSPTHVKKYRNTVSDLKSQSTADTESSNGSAHPIGFRIQSAVTQLGMGFAVVIGLVLLAGLYEIFTNPELVAMSYLGIALFGYYVKNRRKTRPSGRGYVP
jgi:hypothetical protein